MLHDDGQLTDDLEEADVVLVGVSRTSKTPTSIYLANRGVKTANVPLVPGVPLPSAVEQLQHPLIVGLFATRSGSCRSGKTGCLGSRCTAMTTNISTAKRSPRKSPPRAGFARKHNWPLIDVTRRSIEETAAAVLAHLGERRRRRAS